MKTIDKSKLIKWVLKQIKECTLKMEINYVHTEQYAYEQGKRKAYNDIFHILIDGQNINPKYPE
jgi:hypothetical protein